MTTPYDEPAVPSGGGGLVRYRLDIAYDGTDFCGWARQTAQLSVQGEIEDALATILRLERPPRLTVAGRTDAGVHATGQVAHVDLPAHAEAYRLLRALNGVLANDVRVQRVAIAPAGFDARFSALQRRYEFRVSDAPYGAPPLRRRDTMHHDRPLDIADMQAAAAALVGLHDFRAFCRLRVGATTIRLLLRLSCARDGDIVTVTVEADAFCHSMVRSLVGALIAVGDGRQRPDWPAGLLNADRRSDVVTVAQARGLTLVEVTFPPDEDLAARAESTRATRSLSS
ncbi:MAG: tRNA pseudouridine38-40 synthase [Frankiaceae bacterium]|nr:tRNA pseudouridine38-40 synthase [Frankiaceae bacterium]